MVVMRAFLRGIKFVVSSKSEPDILQTKKFFRLHEVL